MSRKINNDVFPTARKPKNAEMNPPDLWIHHDRMELKIGRNSRHVETPIDSIPKSFPEAEEKVPLQNYSSLDKHYTNSYLGMYTIHHGQMFFNSKRS